MQDSIFNLLTGGTASGSQHAQVNYFGPDVRHCGWRMDFPTAPAVLDGVRACVDNEEPGYPPGEDSRRGRQPIAPTTLLVLIPTGLGPRRAGMS